MNKLYTHNDLDGVSCAILAYKDDIDIVVIQQTYQQN